ncbi:MAG: hypothetical protein IJK84_01415 [Bacteroidales bacterium]|nr:hypothetical protein [Bacteroidales bacterium]
MKTGKNQNSHKRQRTSKHRVYNNLPYLITNQQPVSEGKRNTNNKKEGTKTDQKKNHNNQRGK